MFASDRQLDVAIVEECPTENTRLDAKVLAAQQRLDRDLPNAGGAEQELIIRILEQSFGTSGKTLWLTSRPEEDLRVQEELHAPVPNSAAISRSPIRSKSFGTLISPFRNPMRFRFAGASRRDTFTSGFPALAMTNDSPFAARSTRRERCVFAS